MDSAITLTERERTFFTRIGQAIFTNPFEENAESLQALLGVEAHYQVADVSQPHAFAHLVPILQQLLTGLLGRGARCIGDIAAADQTTVKYAVLFWVYNRYVPALTELIQTQRRAGAQSVAVPFAERVLGELERLGFDAAERTRYLGFMYQLRRAYYFIAQSLVGDSPPMQRLRCALWNSVFTSDTRTYEQFLWNRMEDFSTLLLGETGTGKGAAARAIGCAGYIPFDPKTNRFRYSFEALFVPANLAAYPEALIESALFGHRKGAFTGAIDHHKGLFEVCPEHGMLFLDEIGELPGHIQVKLLDVLQDRAFNPVGSRDAKRFVGRVIAATNQPILTRMQQGRFRNDLYYRLSADVIELPTLRVRLGESPQELHQLVEMQLSRIIGSDAIDMAPDLIRRLSTDLPANYSWPGNVRELEQAVRRLLLGRPYRMPALSALDQTSENSFLRQVRDGALDADALLAGYSARLYEQLGSYSEVARRIGLDWRTVRKYVQQ